MELDQELDAKKKDQAKQILLNLIDSLKLTKKEYDLLVTCLKTLHKRE